MLIYQADILVFESVSNIRYIFIIARFQPKLSHTDIPLCQYLNRVKYTKHVRGILLTTLSENYEFVYFRSAKSFT